MQEHRKCYLTVQTENIKIPEIVFLIPTNIPASMYLRQGQNYNRLVNYITRFFILTLFAYLIKICKVVVSHSPGKHVNIHVSEQPVC